MYLEQRGQVLHINIGAKPPLLDVILVHLYVYHQGQAWEVT